MSEWLGRFYLGRHQVHQTEPPADNNHASKRCNVEAVDELLDVSQEL